jgi:alkyl hydroperoxide reductase subunit AhpC
LVFLKPVCSRHSVPSPAIRLGNIVPDFGADTTQGPFDSFHEWKKGKWAILFSHPADFTPVCTTEIGRLALKYDELAALDCLVATLSVDPVKSHNEWLEDVVAHCENKIEIKFPIIGYVARFGIGSSFVFNLKFDNLNIAVPLSF